MRATRGRGRRRLPLARAHRGGGLFGTLRGRLLALFFVVALVPSVGLTFFVTQYLARSLAALKNPETERALGQSLEVIRGGIERLASDARQHAEVMALDPVTVRLMAPERSAELERHLRDEARSRGLDYIALYRVGPDAAERIFGARLGPRITLPQPERASLLEALEHGGLVSGDDAPRQVSGVASLDSTPRDPRRAISSIRRSPPRS